MALLKLSHFSLAIGSVSLLDNIHLSVSAGEHLAILGRSGCGKSSLLKAIMGLETAIATRGEMTTPMAIAYMAQQDALLPWLSAAQNVQLADRLKHSANAQTVEKAHDLLNKMALLEHADKPPYELSGGQRQRVALARTLMQDAELILMDEPFSAVDAITRLELQRLAAELLADKTVILITHDPQEAIRLADTIYVMRDGGLSQPYIPDYPRPRFAVEQSQPALQQQLLEALTT